MTEIKRLSEDDWKTVIPVETLVLGSTILEVKPFTMKSMVKVSASFKVLFDALKETDITTDNWGDADKLIQIFKLVTTNAPALLETAIGLHRDDIAELPVSTQAVVVHKVIKVNVDSKDGFNEALKYLGKLMGVEIPGVPQSQMEESGE